MNFVSILILPVVFIILFFREVRLEEKEFAEKRQADNEHILKEAQRFVTEQQLKKGAPTS